LTAPRTGTYILSFTPNTIYRQETLSVDGKQLINDPGTPPVSTYTASVHFAVGSTHHLVISGSSADLSWITPDVVQPQLVAAAAAAASAHTAVVVVGDDQESEAADRASLDLPSAQNALIAAVAAVNPRTIVVVEAGAAVAMPWLSSVDAVVDQWYPGQTDGRSLAAVLFGSVDPSGHLPVTFPASLARSPVSSPSRFPGVSGKVRYTEGRNIGYRWWVDTGHKPLFPFGYGLSYTRFRFGRPAVKVAGSASSPVVTVRERVTNTGHVAGADVAQLYLAFPARVHEPKRQLAAYHRVSLKAGKHVTITFRIHGLQLSYFAAHGWTIPAGHFHVYVGDSSARAQLGPAVSFRL
jgi:beta-glucosidase